MLFSSLQNTILVALLSFLGLHFWQRKLIYFPDKTKPVLNEERSRFFTEVHTQTKDRLTLTHWYAKNDKPLIVVFHGNAGNIKDRAYKFDFLIEKGYSVFLVSYRGYGGNPGNPSEKNIIKDSELILEWIFKNENISSGEIVLFGESLGSCVMTKMAEKYAFKGLIFEGAPSSLVDVGRHYYPFLPVRSLLVDTWDSLSRIKNVNSPILFIHSKRDSIVPFKFGKKLFDLAPQPKKALWMEYTGHIDNLDDQGAIQAVLDFIVGGK